MDFIKDQWDLIKETVRTEYNLTDISFNTWINPLTLHSVENKTVYIVIPSDKTNAFSYISNKYKNLFNIVYIQLGSCISIVVGQLLGAGKIEEAKANVEAASTDYEKEIAS